MEILETYQNEDGTFTSPKNNKTYKSIKAFRSHWNYKGHVDPNAFAERLYSVKCKYCSIEFNVSGIKRHETACYLNPKNLRLCEVCDKPIKNYKTSKGTCSCGCANTLFRTGSNHGNWSGNNYQMICFEAHGKKCLVCGEEKIVAAHHIDHNHSNNDPTNLIPLCPTHHQYLHSRYKDEIQTIIDDFIK